jgi:hypothetical protein
MYHKAHSMPKLTITGFLLALPAAHAWGAAGHDVTAAIAERHLTAAAAAGVLADLQTFAALYPTESELITSSTWCALC